MEKVAHVKPDCEVTILTNDIEIVPKGQYPYYLLTKDERDVDDVDMWELIRRRYRRVIRIFRRRIDATITEVYSTVPYYRDTDVSGLLDIVMKSKDDPRLHERLYDFIKKRQNVRKENNKKRASQGRKAY